MALYRVTFPFQAPSGEEAQYDYWLTASSAADIPLWITAFLSSLSGSTPWKTMFPSTLTFQSANFSLIDEPTGHVLATTVGVGTAFAGTGTGNLPAEVATCVTLRTASAGRSTTGRFYLPGMISSVITSAQRYSTVSVGNLVSALNAAFAAAATAGASASVVVYSRKNRSTAAVTKYDIGDIPDSQRRRRNSTPEVRQSGVI